MDYREVFAAMDPRDASILLARIRAGELQGVSGMGSWLSQAVRAVGGIATAAVGTINPTAGNALATALSTFYPPQQVQAAAPQAAPASNMPLILAGAAVAAVLLLRKR